jgi:hypothetical protein
VAHLRVDVKGTETALDGGSCEPGDYYGLPLRRPPVSAGIGLGVGGEGLACPMSGSAAGLSSLQISQIDDLSGGLTETQIPLIARTTPLNGETLYGRFIAQARSGLAGPTGGTYAVGTPIDLTIKRAGSGARVFHAGNVNTVHGAAVRALPKGVYVAIWVLRDANGDTRTLRTEFFEAR